MRAPSSITSFVAVACFFGCSVDVSGTGAPLDALVSPSLPDPAGDAGLDAAAPADGAGPTPVDGRVEDDAGPVADGALPVDAFVPPLDAGIDAAEDAAPPDADVPVTQPAHAGDYPDDPYGETYLPVAGVFGPGGAPRGYKLHVPPAFVQGTPFPVLFAFHGEGHTGALFASYGAELIGLSDDLGLVLVVPNGVQAPGEGGGWNGGACCGASARAGVDDVAFVRAVLADVRTRLRVDAGRTYAVGFSSGGFLAYRLACELSDVFAAVAVVGGGIGTPALSALPVPANAAFAQCAPTRPVAVLHVHGDADAYVPYPALTRATNFWSTANGCSAQAAPASVPVPTGSSHCESYAGCRGDMLVTACTVTSGGHCWFGSSSCGTGTAPDPAQHIGSNSDDLFTTPAVADFLARLPRR